jgi:hypothetical protein
MAREAMTYSPVVFTKAQIASVARGMGDEITKYKPAPVYSYACMRDHFHIVTGLCRYDVRRFEGRLKGAATKQLLKDRIHPMQKFAKNGIVPTPWGVNPWVVYLFSEEEMLRAIEYVEQNPVGAGLGRQIWDFVQPYHGRTPGAAHPR